ncbi:hypothetical protein SLEP1_g23007 [Rubroshorea leprosula]|uniref:Uncharacterized protein n=1 Tax=Rubroshorea leprosula TaxID=152421 RepID=A0AAV5JE08_9ROSI|nr:hypothetical protein SLEP1_g23007 [Rubroshorea leprosula]
MYQANDILCVFGVRGGERGGGKSFRERGGEERFSYYPLTQLSGLGLGTRQIVRYSKGPPLS